MLLEAVDTVATAGGQGWVSAPPGTQSTSVLTKYLHMYPYTTVRSRSILSNRKLCDGQLEIGGWHLGICSYSPTCIYSPGQPGKVVAAQQQRNDHAFVFRQASLSSLLKYEAIYSSLSSSRPRLCFTRITLQSWLRDWFQLCHFVQALSFPYLQYGHYEHHSPGSRIRRLDLHTIPKFPRGLYGKLLLIRCSASSSLAIECFFIP